MHIICLTPLEDGVYNDHSADHITTPPEGWAYIPDDFPLPTTFPRLGSIEAEEKTYIRKAESIDDDGKTVTKTVEYTMMTVTSMTEGTLPDPIEPEPTVEQRIATLEQQLSDADDAVIELYEQNEAAAIANSEQDAAIIELYELIEGGN